MPFGLCGGSHGRPACRRLAVSQPTNDANEVKVDRRRLRTRSALIGAGQRLFAARSIDGVTIDDIVAAADVAKGSFYNHFDDKESLAGAIVDLVQGDCEREVASANLDVTDPASRVARAMAALIRYARAHPDRYRSMVSLSKRRTNIEAPINAGLRRDIAAGLDVGQFSGITLQGGMLTVFGLIATAVEYLSATRARSAPPEIAREMAFILLRALGVSTRRAQSIAEKAVADLFPEPADEDDHLGGAI
nr:TetR/AcrR family transcriptional regulator [Novosphingobium sp. SG720]